MSFLAHSANYGLMLDYAIADERWHRCRTVDKPHKKNGVYIWNGLRGAVRNWATMDDFAAYRDGQVHHIDQNAWRETRRRARDEQLLHQSGARVLAYGMLQRARVSAHSYLIAKGFPAEGGFVADGELLLPMRDIRIYSTLNSLQRISPSGDKRFLARGKAQDSVFMLGNHRAREHGLCEGYVTGLSLRAALRDLRREARIVVCFSASNLLRVAALMRRGVFVMVDNDVSGTGEKVARAHGAAVVHAPRGRT